MESALLDTAGGRAYNVHPATPDYPGRDPQLAIVGQYNCINALELSGEYTRASELLLKSGLREAFADDGSWLFNLIWLDLQRQADCCRHSPAHASAAAHSRAAAAASTVITPAVPLTSAACGAESLSWVPHTAALRVVSMRPRVS